MPRLELGASRARPPGASASPEQVQAAAQHGISGAAGALPHQEAIQRSFGRHDISHIKAYTDGAAEQGAKQMGARAFATGDHVAFAEPPSLHTAAHEAAHVIQQRAGVQLAGGVGAAGDSFEQNADEVADRVVRGEPAEDLLGPIAGPHNAAGTNVQRLLYDFKIEGDGLDEATAREVIRESLFLFGLDEGDDEASAIEAEVISRYLASEEKILVSEAVERVYDERQGSPGEGAPSPALDVPGPLSSASDPIALGLPHDGAPYGPDCKAFRWTQGAWQPLHPGYAGPMPHDRGDQEGEVLDVATNKWYRSEADYRRYTQPLRSPPFVQPPSRDEPLLPGGLPVSGRASNTLRSFLQDGIRTPAQLHGQATSSADDKRRTGAEISVNVLKPEGDPAKLAKYATMNAANGAIPVVIEQHGDGPSASVDDRLAQRARESAVAVIRPDDLSGVQQDAIRLMPTSGEATLEGAIPSSHFVRVLVPREFMTSFTPADVARYKIQFVGSTKAQVPYNPGGTQVEIDVPAFEAALAAILASNPESTFLTHAIRLGAAQPIPADGAPGKLADGDRSHDEEDSAAVTPHGTFEDESKSNGDDSEDDEIDLC